MFTRSRVAFLCLKNAVGVAFWVPNDKPLLPLITIAGFGPPSTFSSTRSSPYSSD